MYKPKDMPSDYVSNGCGSGWNVDLVPDNLAGFDITSACYVHDYMYEVGGDSGDKFIADSVFLANMLALIDEQDTWYIPEAKAVKLALLYYEAVVKFGNDKFNWRV